MSHAIERRRHPRRPCRLPVRALGGVAARTTDLSEGGARLQRLDEGPLRIGARFDLELDLPDGPLRTAAEVVAVDGEGPLQSGAVRFAALAPENQERLRALTRRRAMRPGARPLARLQLAQRSLHG